MLLSAGNIIGGLGLLLIGMSLMTDGLKLAAGNALRDILALWTNTRKRGLLSGVLITGIVQSSSAVTVATIGFANAGMLSLERALWVIYGSNVGTTLTAWIVAVVGFKVNIEAFALPLIGIGTLLKLSGGDNRRSFFGLALVGFGLLFLGIDILKNAFDAAGGNFSVPATSDLTLVAVMTFVGIGFLLTTLMQSSSAAMVVALSAAESGILPLNLAAAVVIGANLGTTTTAIISVFGATPTAKRVAFGHVCFNVVTAFAAIGLLAPMLYLGGVVQGGLNQDGSPAVSLAIFHTSFNILGVLLMWPLSERLTRFLLARFRTVEETQSKPQYLDKNVLALPYIAVDALTLELSRVAVMNIHLTQQALGAGLEMPVARRKALIIRNLCKEIGNFSSQLNKIKLTPFLSEALVNLMHVTQEYLMACDIAEDIAQLSMLTHQHQHSHFADNLAAFCHAADRHLNAMTPDNTANSIVNPDLYREVETTYDTLKEAILLQTSLGALDVADMDALLQYANQVKRGCRHLWKAARRLNVVREALQRNPENQVQESDKSDTANIESLQDTEKFLAEEKDVSAEPSG